ncbi:hypothetical protein CBR_g70711 [Chara braunii]|uniref:RRM domain-containing protein n=1 Tax=Chara braunii TaxID=69332 RepID=A0A388KA64_CHABU|nr:hypothetical protein CBR_g70711 [Chara braunii]|eukprot:GBG66833.1 hypothetical protein CBR_g70711 [Chara braunii]
MALRSPPVTLSKGVQPLINRSGSHPLAAEAIPPSGSVSSSSSPARSPSLCKLPSTSPSGAWSKTDTSTWRSGSCRHQFRPFGSSSSSRRSVLATGAVQGWRIGSRVTWESDCCDCSPVSAYQKTGADMRIEAKKPMATLLRGPQLGEGNSSRRGTGLSRRGSDGAAELVSTCTSTPSASSVLVTSPTSSAAGESGAAEEDRQAAVSFVGTDNDNTDESDGKSSRGPVAAVLEQRSDEESADSSQVESGSSSPASSALSSSVSSSSSSSAPSPKSSPSGKKGHGSGRRVEEEGSGGEKGKGGEGEKGKIYIGGIPPMVTKEDVAEFFAQCGKVDRIILIKGHRRPEVNRGFCFLYFAEPGSVEAAARAVAELNGADFQGHKLRVVADDGHFLRERNAVTDHRLRTGDDTFVFRSDWHRKRHEAGLRLRELLKSTKAASDPRAVQKAFEEIDKPRLGDFALLVTYHARRGDKHSARSTFERMRSLRIPPNDFVYTSLINSYVMAGDMRNAMNCLEEMELEGVPPNAATYTVLIHGHARQKDAVSAELMFERMKRAKISPLVAAYQVLIDAFCKADDVERIEKAMAEMEAQGLDPNLTIYNNLLSTFSRLGKTDKCLDSFTKLKVFADPILVYEAS